VFDQEQARLDNTQELVDAQAPLDVLSSSQMDKIALWADDQWVERQTAC
jgi:hypothetical protein